MTAQKYFCEIDFPPSPRPLLSLLFSFRGPRSLSVRGQFSFRGLYCKDLFPWRHLVERDLGVRSFEPWARSISSQLLSRTWITSKSNQSNVMRTEVRKTHSGWRETLDDMFKLLHTSVVGCWSLATNRSLVFHASWPSVIGHRREKRRTRTNHKGAKVL